MERVKFTKFLGVILHENLTWANHVSYLANKIHKSIGILKALQPKLPISSLHMLYNTLVYPYLQYCNIAWASQYNTLVERIFILHKGITHCLQKAHTQQLFKLLHTLKITDIHKHQTCCFMYKAKFVIHLYFIGIFRVSFIYFFYFFSFNTFL